MSARQEKITFADMRAAGVHPGLLLRLQVQPFDRAHG
jgi:hypothetical protein